MARFREQPLEFEPGSKFTYSNSGYVLLGYLLEKISGEKYGDFLEKNLFVPLVMSNTGMDNARTILPGRAQGYTLGPHGVEHAGYTSMTIPFSAGALYSTTGDLLKWELGLFGGKILKPESLKKMTTPFKENYAFGLISMQEDGQRMITHGGGIEGFRTSLTEYPDIHLTVVVLANSDRADPDALGRALGALALGKPLVLPSERKEVPVSESLLKEYAGVYRLAPTFALTMTVEDGKLMTQATGQGKLQLLPESASKFFLKVVDAEVEFVRDPASGAVTEAILYQNGMAQHARKEIRK